MNSPISQYLYTIDYGVLSKQSHISGIRVATTVSLTVLLSFIFLLFFVPLCLWCQGGWRWRGNVMHRSDWSETVKTQVHTRVAYIAALLSVHTSGHVRTWACLTTDSHTSIHIHCVRSTCTCTRIHTQSNL